MLLVVFLLRRFAGMAVVLVVVSFLVFGLLALSPGSVLATLLGTQPASPELVAAIKAEHHLDDPFLIQYWAWLVHALQGDFGRSVQSGEPVIDAITARLPVTLELASFAGVLVLMIGIPVGMLAGIRHGRVFDRVTSGVTVIGMSSPAFAIGILLIYLLGVRMGSFPVFGPGDGSLGSRLEHLTLPAVALAFHLCALIVRQTRAATFDVMSRDYVTFARARGLSPSRIVVRYALRNTAVPVVTATGLLFVVLLSGAVLVEKVFSLSGAGQLMVESVTAKDIPVVQGLAFFTALLVVVLNLIVDAVVLVIDPRTRSSAKAAAR